MKRYFAHWQCCCLALLFLVSSTDAYSQNPVSVSAEIKPADAKQKNSNRYIVDFHVTIDDGWHIYDVVPKGEPVVKTDVSLSLPVGVKAVGNIQRPLSLPYFKKPGTKVFQNDATFSQTLNVGDDFDSGKIKLTLKYQVCNDQRCQPPAELTAFAKVPTQESTRSDGNSAELFDAPVMLMVDGKPLNTRAKQMYPSPAMFDIDNDGQTELVVGDIFGSLNVYKNRKSSEKGDPVWSKHERLKSVDNKPIKVSNW